MVLDCSKSRPLGASFPPLLGDDDLARERTPCMIMGADAVALVRRSKNGIGGGRFDASLESPLSETSVERSAQGPSSSSSSAGFISICDSTPTMLSFDMKIEAEGLLTWTGLFILCVGKVFLCSELSELFILMVRLIGSVIVAILTRFNYGRHPN